jgi:hypothetical protein
MAAPHRSEAQTAGMLRIEKDQQERHIWPVHLPGWMATGWRVAGANAPVLTDGMSAVEAGTETAPTPTPADLELQLASDEKPGSTRVKRGRKTREELSQEPPADAALPAQPAAAEAEEAPITALPDDLFDDALI